jgi:hypothetical protein
LPIPGKGLQDWQSEWKNIQLRLFVVKSEEGRRLSALVVRCKLLGHMLNVEKNRLRTAYLEMKSSIRITIACLEAEIKRLDEEICTFMKEHENFKAQEKLLCSSKSKHGNLAGLKIIETVDGKFGVKCYNSNQINPLPLMKRESHERLFPLYP